MTLLRMAWRNVLRDRRRSLISIGAMTFALWVLILYSGLVTGIMVHMEQDMLDLEIGDIQIFAEGYRDRPSLYARIDAPEELAQRLRAAGLRASPRLLGGGLAAVGESAAGVMLMGVDPEGEREVSRLPEALASGTWLDAAEPHGVVLGRRLAKTLAAGLGDELVLLTQAADGSMAADLFTIRGVLMGISEGTDRRGVFMPAAAYRELMVVPEGAHQMLVRRPRELPLADAGLRAREVAPDLDVLTWRELMPTIATMMDSTQAMMTVIFGTVYLAVGILVLNAMLMAVFERIRELGVLKALGVGPAWVMALILVESLIQAGVAIALGTVLSLPGVWYLARTGIDIGGLAGMSMMGLAMRPVWRGIYSVQSMASPILALLAIVLVAVIYPGLKAAWIRPVRAMRHL